MVSKTLSMFEEEGGKFVISEDMLLSKLNSIDSFVFDWDGVFSDARKFSGDQSFFSETDSMGVNLLRFGYFLKNGKLPIISIITGEDNVAATELASREHFNSIYTKTANKIEAVKHLNTNYRLTINKTAFIFDDILDLNVASDCGLRIFVSHRCTPLFKQYVNKHKLADYITANKGGNGAVRESCEFFLGLWGIFDEVVEHRIAFSEKYKEYLTLRQAISPRHYICQGDQIREREDY